MTQTPAVRRLLAGVVLLVGSVTQANAQNPQPGQMLDPKLAPKQEDVVLSTPGPDEVKSCTVELVKGTAANSSGWLLKDAKGQSLRRFFDSNGDGKVDTWSYYKDNVEVYREFDSTYKAGRPNNFRWLNTGGMKWGVGAVDDKTGKGAIEYWRMISSEEVGFEAFQAIAKQDFSRLKLLFITDAEMQALKLSPRTVSRYREAQKDAPKKFSELLKKVNLASARFERVEGAPVSCVLEDGPAGEINVIKYLVRPVLYELNKKNDWIYTTEIVQVGLSWRLADVPTDVDPNGGGGGTPSKDNPELQNLYDQIAKLDQGQPAPPRVLEKNAKADAYFRERIALVQKIIPLDKAEQRDTWYKQLFDNLTAMAQNTGDAAPIALLKQLADGMKESNLAGYGTYRSMWTGYALDMARTQEPKEIAKIQEKWLEQLGDFVKKFSKADDTPEALHQLGIGCEFGGKDEEAKRWYGQLADSFPEHNLAPRARGSVARLNLPGREMKLSAPLLADSSKTFDIAQLKGKVVIVHYWASDSTNFADDFVRLKRVLDQVGSKVGVELVCVNLDDRAETAKEALKKVPGSWTHLYQAPSNNSGGGLNGPLAVQYGIHMLPTTFMVGRDGRVTNRALQIGDVESELKKVQ